MSEPSPPDAKQPNGFDWGAVYRRLEASRMALEPKGRPRPAEGQRILKARAQALAQEPDREEATRGGSKSWSSSWRTKCTASNRCTSARSIP
jgi:hypothetical protein